MADGSLNLAAVLTDAKIVELAQAAASHPIVERRVRPNRRARAVLAAEAAVIVRDFLYRTPRGIARAKRCASAGGDPSRVLDVAGLAQTLVNAHRDRRRADALVKAVRGRPLKRLHAEREAKKEAREQAVRSARLATLANAESEGLAHDHDADEVCVVDYDADPLLQMIAIEESAIVARIELDRAAAQPAPAPAPVPRHPREILHLRRSAGGAP